MSEIRVDSIKNTVGTGSPSFTGTITADGFVKSGGESGFLKADGTVDNTTYLSNLSLGNATVTLVSSGLGLSLSASPSFTLNQTANKSITITLDSNTWANPNSIVARDNTGGSSFTGLSGVNITAYTSLASQGGAYFYNTGMVNNPLTLTGIYNSPALDTDVSASFATGINIPNAAGTADGGVIEFYKTRRTDLSSETRVTAQAGDAVMALHASADDGTSDAVIASLYACVTGVENLSNSSNKGGFFKFTYNADDSFGSNNPNKEWVTIGESLNGTDAVGPTTIRIPFAATGSQSANCSFDADGRLVRQASTRAIKKNIETLDRKSAYNVLNNLRPVWYQSIAPADNPEWGYYGAIAEEVAEVDPRLAIWGYADDQYTENRKLKEDAQLTPQGVQYDRLATILFTVVKDQQTAIADLEAKVRALESAQN